MLGRNKMYKKGLADAMHGYEDFGKKQAEALRKIRQEVSAGNKKLETALAEMGENVFAIFDLLDKKEKEALYHLHTPMDIKDLEDSEKRLLLAILFQLAEDEGDSRYNEYQRKYILSVKKYLEIANPQTEAEYSSIENIGSIDVQKVFLRVILEFLYLQDEDEITDWQEDLLDCFSVNKKYAKIIECDVIRRYHILGAEGLAENYGEVMDLYGNGFTAENTVPDKAKKLDKGIPLSVLEKIGFKYYLSWGQNYFEFTDCFETVDYFVFFNEGIWHRYDKNSKEIDAFEACSNVMSGDFSRTYSCKSERTSVDYDSNRVVYVDENKKINVVNVENDEKIILDKIDYNGYEIQLQESYVLVRSSEGLYYIEIETQKATYIKDANGSQLRVKTATMMGNLIFLNTEYDGIDNDGANMRDSVYLYDIYNNTLELCFEKKILDGYIDKLFIYDGCLFVLGQGKLHTVHFEDNKAVANLVAEWKPEYCSKIVLDNNKLFFMEKDSFEVKMIKLDTLETVDVVKRCSELYKKVERIFLSSKALIKERKGSYFTVGQWIYFTNCTLVLGSSENFKETAIYRANINRPDSPVKIKTAESIKVKY